MTTVPWSFSTATELPRNPADLSEYINNLNYHRWFVGNPYVSKVEFHLASMTTEAGYDFLTFVQGTNTMLSLSGAPVAQWLVPQEPNKPQTSPVKIGFSTDGSVEGLGVVLDQARVCCDSTPSTSLLYGMETGERYTGTLHGTSDVVYLRKAPGPANSLLSVTLWGPDGADFDLYARCGDLPTPTVHDLHALSSNAQEQFASGTNGCASWWYIAVHSYSGSGQFNIVATDVKYSDNPSESGILPLRIGVGAAVNTTFLTQIQGTMAKAAKFLYGATEGRIRFGICAIFNNAGTDCANCGGVPCDVCFKPTTGPSTAPICGPGQVILTSASGYWSDYRGVAHELAHKYLCTRDEYGSALLNCDANTNPGCTCDPNASGDCQWKCGHSIMANTSSTNNNLCVDGFDHKKDPTPGAPPTIASAAWFYALNMSLRVLDSPTATPDNFDYVSHDFNDAFICFIVP